MNNLAELVKARRDLPVPKMRRALREAAGVSQDAIAIAVGVHRMTVNRWESGRCEPTPAHVVAYAAIMRALQDETRGQR